MLDQKKPYFDAKMFGQATFSSVLFKIIVRLCFIKFTIIREKYILKGMTLESYEHIPKRSRKRQVWP